MVMVEVNQLANDLPRYEITLSEKMRNLRDAVGRAGLLTNASNLLKDLNRELNAKGQTEAPATKPALPDDAKGRPVPVEVHQPDPAASETLVAMLRPLVTPFTTTGIVVIFLIFFLFQREDLRNRFIRLAGSDDLERTTAAMAAANVQNVLMVIARLRWHARTCSSPRPNGEGPAAATPLKGSGLTEPFSMCRAIAGACRKLLKLWNLSTAKLKRRFRQNWAEMATNFETI